MIGGMKGNELHYGTVGVEISSEEKCFYAFDSRLPLYILQNNIIHGENRTPFQNCK
jgi:hypothetical protein